MSSKNKKSVEPNSQPKKPLSAFFIYMNENRELVKQKFPNIPPKELTVKFSELYKTLDEKERKKYDDKAKKAKEAYEEAKKVFLANGGQLKNKKNSPEPDEPHSKKQRKTSVSKAPEVKEPEKKTKEKKAAAKEEKKADTKPQKKKQ